MPRLIPASCLLLGLFSGLPAQTALTVYNQGFAVVRERVPLDLRAGETSMAFGGVTAQLEADSVVLRDPAGRVPFRVVEQSYRADVMSQSLLLSLNEGRELDFLVRDQNAKEFRVRGLRVRETHDALARHDEHMHGRLCIDVVKRDEVLRLVDDLRGDLAGGYFFKDSHATWRKRSRARAPADAPPRPSARSVRPLANATMSVRRSSHALHQCVRLRSSFTHGPMPCSSQ